MSSLLLKIRSFSLINCLEDTSYIIESVGLFISAFVLTHFFYRVAKAYRLKYLTSFQDINVFSVFMTMTPIISQIFLQFYIPKYSFWYSFNSISSFLSMLYPLIIGMKVWNFASLFPWVLMFSVLSQICYPFIFVFGLSIPASFICFHNETSAFYTFQKIIVFPLLMVCFTIITVFYKPHESNINLLITFIGSFFGLVFGTLL